MVANALPRVDAEDSVLAAAPWRDRDAEADMMRFRLRRQLELGERDAGFTPGDLGTLAAYFAGLARRGAPLGEARELDRIATAFTLAELWANAEPGEVTALLGLSRWMVRHNRRLDRLLIRVHTERTGADPVGSRGARRADRLLAGLETVEDPTVPAGSAYLVVASEPVHEDASQLVPGALNAYRDGYRVTLVPMPGAEAEMTMPGLVAAACRREGLHAGGVVAASATEIPAAASAAMEIARVSPATGRPPGLFGPQDVVLEDVLHRGGGSTRLARVLDPLGVDPRLVETLCAFFASDLDRSRTAATLGISRGGLSLRLTRIAVLTGLDPRTTRGIQVLTSALSARALIHLGGGEQAQ